ncbi:hypothetical protein JCM9279_004266 [Rhodotorula babjevae]
MESDALQDPPRASLAALPPELALRIAANLDPRSLVRLGSTSSRLHAVACTESLWKRIVLDLVDHHGQAAPSSSGDELVPASSSPPAGPSSSSTWQGQAKVLLPHSHHLGFFASNQPYSSRIIRVSIIAPTLAHPAPDAPPPTYSIRAAQFVPRNRFDNPLYPLLGDGRPFGSSRDPMNPAAYIVNPRLNLDHPYSGLSVDVLEPTFDSSSAPVFDISPTDGPCLAQGYSSMGPRGAPRPPQPTTTTTLRLQLEPVTERVERNAAATHPDGSPSSIRDELNPESLFALFSGRLPRRQWPTLALVGLEEVSTADIPILRAGRTDPPRNILRLAPGGGGAFRGLVEALKDRNGERPLAQVVQPSSPSSSTQPDEAFVTGFRIRARRTPRAPLGASGAHERAETSSRAGTGERWSAPGAATRRRGVGGNGGPAVLWHGEEQDPDDEPQVTILRAGDEGEGGFVLRIPDTDTRRPPRRAPNVDADLDEPMLDGGADRAQAARAGSAESDDSDVERASLADIVDSASESFFPIKAPARPLSWDDPSPIDEHGDVLASSLEGLWLGTYGGHGLEFVNLTTGFVEMPVEDERGGEEGGYGSSDSEGEDRRVQYRRVVTATKVTGDPNVPSVLTDLVGSPQTSWVAILPPSPRHSHPLTATVPTVPLSTFEDLSELDPHSAAYLALNNGAGPDWSVGTARAFGRIALTGFASPSWTGAQVRFLKSEVRVRRARSAGDEGREGEGQWEERSIETVEELHLRWEDLQKVGVFKRVRV